MRGVIVVLGGLDHFSFDVVRDVFGAHELFGALDGRRLVELLSLNSIVLVCVTHQCLYLGCKGDGAPFLGADEITV